MSYPQPPYQPPQGPLGYAYPPPGFPDPLAPARRASVMLFVLGALGALCGLYFALAIWLVPLDQVMEQVKSQMTQQQLNQLPSGMDLTSVVRVMCTVGGVLSLLISIGMLASGVFVRRGSRGAIITSLVICILLVLWCGIAILATLGQLISGNASAAIGIIIWIALGGMVGITIVWLVQALRASGQFHQQQQYMMQYWYQQQQQANPGQAGYGYGAPPAPSNLPPSPPAPQ